METEIGDLGWEAAGASDSSVMILTCPECATSYFVDDSRIAAAGRTVKCSNCGARWTALPEGAEPPAPPPPKPAPVVAPLPPPAPLDEVVFEAPPAAPVVASRPSAPRREAGGKVLVWAIAAVVVAGLVAGAVVFRAQVVRLLPASQAAYAGLGLPVSPLAIEQVRADAGFQGGHPALSVTGQLRNPRDQAANAPALRVSLLDRLGKPVAVKIARPIDAAVPARSVRHFAISIVDPPAATHDLEVSFEPAGKTRPVAVALPAAAAALPAPK
jgi:predicted Zn finger-like uncharacterized protein